MLLRNGYSYQKVVEDMSEPYSTVLWKVELMSNESEYLAEEIPKQRVEGIALILLTVYRKM